MLPKPVYESLPFIYITGGIISISMIESFVSFFSGILLGISGIAILWFRHNYRSTRCECPHSRVGHYSS